MTVSVIPSEAEESLLSRESMGRVGIPLRPQGRTARNDTQQKITIQILSASNSRRND